jgi:serine/threonine protein kinase
MALVTNLSAEVLKTYKVDRIIRHIPSGQRKVYIVESDGKPAVLKVMSPGMAAMRLPRELTIYQEFSSQIGIPTVIDCRVIEGSIVILEEFVEGDNLNTIEANYLNDSAKTKFILSHLVQILLPLWSRGIVHRDIKPENIIVKPDSTPVLLDFGIAKDFNDASVTEAGFQPFSPLYGAPEQYQGDKTKISYRTDMFSLGVLGYKLFYGSLPFGESKREIDLRFQDANNTLSLDNNDPLYRFLTSCLSFSPSERPRRPNDLIQMLA